MDKDFWHERWHASQIGFHQEEINPWLVQYWPTLGLDRGQRIFVPLCGKSRDIIWLLDQGYRVIGVEISPIAVEAFFSENGITPHSVAQEESYTRWSRADLEILCGDFFDLNQRDIADCSGVYDRAAMIALPPEMRTPYCEHLARILGRHGRGLLVTLEYPQEQMTGPPFSVSAEEIRKLLGACFDIRMLDETNILESHSRFRDQGLTSLTERIYRIERF